MLGPGGLGGDPRRREVGKHSPPPGAEKHCPPPGAEKHCPPPGTLSPARDWPLLPRTRNVADEIDCEPSFARPPVYFGVLLNAATTVGRDPAGDLFRRGR